MQAQGFGLLPLSATFLQKKSRCSAVSTGWGNNLGWQGSCSDGKKKWWENPKRGGRIPLCQRIESFNFLGDLGGSAVR